MSLHVDDLWRVNAAQRKSSVQEFEHIWLELPLQLNKLLSETLSEMDQALLIGW